RFWLRGACRLYPLYWASVAAALLLATAGRYRFEPDYLRAPVAATLANLTMLPGFFRLPAASVVYWTLGLEFLFYAFATILFVRRTVGLYRFAALATLALALLAIVAMPVPVGARYGGIPGGLILNFAMLLVGATLARASGRRATVVGVTAAVACAVAVSWWAY